MYASQTSTKPSVVWQGSTKDGYTLRLTRSALTQISSQLQKTGLENFVRRLRSNNQSSLESAVMRAIAQVISRARASRTVSSQEFGRNLQAFTAIGKTRRYQILTQPSDRQQGVIVFVRSRPIQEFEYEGEFEGVFESEYEGRPPRRRRASAPGRLPSGRLLTPQQRAQVRVRAQAQSKVIPYGRVTLARTVGGRNIIAQVKEIRFPNIAPNATVVQNAIGTMILQNTPAIIGRYNKGDILSYDSGNQHNLYKLKVVNTLGALKYKVKVILTPQ